MKTPVNGVFCFYYLSENKFPMQRLKILCIALITLSLSSCYEEFTNVEIKEDGSGSYINNMDMNQLIDMIKTFAGDEELSKQGLDKPLDTILQLKDFVDADSSMSEEKKQLLGNGTIQLKMNIAENIFKLTTSIPFSNAKQLKMLMEGAGNGAVAGLIKNTFGNKSEQPSADTKQVPDMLDLNSIYDVTVQNGLISRKMNMERYNAMKQNPEITQLQQVGSAGLEIIYSTVIKLPVPVKKFDNKLMQVSDDKQTVGFRYNLLDIFNEPAKFDYTIEY